MHCIVFYFVIIHKTVTRLHCLVWFSFKRDIIMVLWYSHPNRLLFLSQNHFPFVKTDLFVKNTSLCFVPADRRSVIWEMPVTCFICMFILNPWRKVYFCLCDCSMCIKGTLHASTGCLNCSFSTWGEEPKQMVVIMDVTPSDRRCHVPCSVKHV